MKYKVVISNTIHTRVKGFYKDESGVSKPFTFELVQDRLDQTALDEVIGDKSENTAEFIRRITHGWKGQRLVLTEDDQPAEFCAEALDALLNITGMANFCFQAYVGQVLVKEKN